MATYDNPGTSLDDKNEEDMSKTPTLFILGKQETIQKAISVTELLKRLLVSPNEQQADPSPPTTNPLSHKSTLYRSKPKQSCICIEIRLTTQNEKNKANFTKNRLRLKKIMFELKNLVTN